MVKAQPAPDGGAPALSVYEVLRHLRGVRKSGDGWIALCPTHEDARPSLSVGTGRDGRLLLNCHANKGCDYHGILSALGFDRSDSATFVSSSTATLAARVETPKKSDAPPDNLSPDNPSPNAGAKDSSPSVQYRTDAEAVYFYDYRDASGALRYQVMRFDDPKDFRPRHYDEQARVWKRGLPTGERVLYRLPELLAARERDAAEPVFVCEGEKDADALIERGLVATTNAGGAKSWRDEYAETLRGAHVCIVVDHDRAGVERGETVARSVASVAASVKVLDLFDGELLPDKHGKDVSDFLAASGTASDLVRLAEAAAEWQPQAANATTPATPAAKQSQATRLVALASSVEFFHTPENRAFARVTVNDHIETVSVKSGAFRDWLLREHRQREGTTPGTQALQDALNDLQGTARFDSPQRECHTRIAEHEGAIYVDLCNDAWQAVRVTSTGWSIIESKDLPVMFRRTRGMLALPMPETGGKLSDLQRFINVRPEDWSLVAAWLVAAFRPNRPFAVLTLNGEQGSAKSTTARILRALIDPNKAALRSVQRDERELMIAATNGWIVALDNLSNLRAWLSDSLCRLSTGGGFAARENYSDDEEVLFDAMRPVLLNGIEELATRSDLLDRAIIVALPTIAEENRREQEEVWREFELARPRLFGACLAAVATALRNFPNTQLERKPRMADFARWSVAAETAFDCAPGAFLAAYTTNRTAANELALEAAPVASAVLSFVEEVETWSGTAGELLKEISPRAGDITHLEGWAKSPRALSGTLKRLAPNLRASGVEVTTGIRTTNGRRMIRLEKTRKSSSLSSLRHFTPDLQAETSDDASDATGGSDESGKSSSLENSNENGLSDGSDDSDDEIHDFSNYTLTDEEAELAAQFEYYGATREEADATARRMFQEVSF